MFIEVVHNTEGDIVGCWAANTLPEGGSGVPLVGISQLIEGHAQCRVNIDTITAMEIDTNCGQKAVIENGQPKIMFVSYTEYICKNYRVGMSQDIPVQPGIIPAGMKMRGLVKK